MYAAFCAVYKHLTRERHSSLPHKRKENAVHRKFQFECWLAGLIKLTISPTFCFFLALLLFVFWLDTLLLRVLYYC